jgi:osmotically-inducible protein OsmY
MKEMINEKAEKVRNAIISHASFNPNWEINIFEDNNVITLTGSVSSKKDVNLIESIAMDQEGVLGVINKLNIDESLHKKAAEGDDVNPDLNQVRILVHRS